MATNTITLKGHGIRNEAIANAAITPGHLVELMSTGKVRVHATAGGAGVERAFAIEDDLQGNDIADAYATGAIVQYNIFRPGDEVYALLANGETAVIGSKLESAGDGTLRVVDADTSAGTIAIQSQVAVALEAVDMSDSSAADPSGRIKVRIM